MSEDLLKKLDGKSVEEIRKMKRPIEFEPLKGMTKKEIKRVIGSRSKEFFTYLLLRPNGLPFYVGKGKSNRLFSHERAAKNTSINTLNLNTIRKIIRNNNEVKYYISKFSKSESEIFQMEKRLIAYYGRRDIDERGILSNRALGGEGLSGYVPSEEQKRVQSSSLKQWHKTHPEFGKTQGEFMKKWIEGHPEEFSRGREKSNKILRTQEYRSAQSERLIKYFEENPEANQSLYENLKQWQDENPEIVTKIRQKVIEKSRTLEARKATSVKVKRWGTDHQEEALRNLQKSIEKNRQPEAKRRARKKTLEHSQKKNIVRSRCLDLIRNHFIEVDLPDGRNGLSFWKEFEKELGARLSS